MLYLKYKFCLKNWRFNDSVFFISCPQFLFCNSNILLLNGYTVLYSNQQKALLSYHKHVLIGCEIIIQTKPPRYSIGTRFVDPPFFFLNSSLLWDIFIINSVEQLQTLPKTKSEIDISPFLKTQKPSSTLFYKNSIRDRYKPISKNTKTLLYSILQKLNPRSI
jgi:hypothetical protein